MKKGITVILLILMCIGLIGLIGCKQEKKMLQSGSFYQQCKKQDIKRTKSFLSRK